MRKLKSYYFNRLPHIVPPGNIFFITFRLYDSLPDHVVSQYFKETASTSSDNRKGVFNETDFEQFDAALDSSSYGPIFLKNKAVAQLVIEQLKRRDKEWYDLIAYCIMPNHVHLLIDTSLQLQNLSDDQMLELEKHYVQLDRIMQSIKGTSARYCNQLLKRSGPFWQKDSYDRYIRNERHIAYVIDYILNNPVKAGLVDDWEKWPFSFYKYQ